MLKNIAPMLFKKAKRKNISVSKALQDSRWITHILPVQSSEEIHEYVSVWNAVRQIQLTGDREDSIRWRWTVDGEYT